MVKKHNPRKKKQKPIREILGEILETQQDMKNIINYNVQVGILKKPK